jgi:hypothetical protein
MKIAPLTAVGQFCLVSYYLMAQYPGFGHFPVAFECPFRLHKGYPITFGLFAAGFPLPFLLL